MNNYKIIACDMDETLLSSDATICQRNIEAIAKAVEKGVKFVPCTGRGFRSIDGVLKTLHLFEQPDQYVIGFNGGNITENKGSRSLFWDPIPFDLADQIFRKCCTYGQCLHIYTRDVVYITNITPDEEAFLKGRMGYVPCEEQTLDFIRGKEEVSKLILTNTDYDYLEKVHADMKPLLDDITVSFSSNRYIEFMHKASIRRRPLEISRHPRRASRRNDGHWRQYQRYRYAQSGRPFHRRPQPESGYPSVLRRRDRCYQQRRRRSRSHRKIRLISDRSLYALQEGPIFSMIKVDYRKEKLSYREQAAGTGI